MNKVNRKGSEGTIFKGPTSGLERKYMEEYLHSKGYSMKSVQALPEKERQQLMRKACEYASLKLAEIEAKAKFKHDIHYRS